MNTNINHQEYVADILVVDDKLENIRFLSDYLSTQGYKIRKAINGQTALIAAKSSVPDLIMLDINMPVMSGYEVCQELKQDSKTSHVPIIFLSAGNDIESKARAFQVGGADYITKPFQLEEVLVRVQTHLKIKTLEQELFNCNQELQQTRINLQKTQTDLEETKELLLTILAAIGNAELEHQISDATLQEIQERSRIYQKNEELS